MDYIETQSDIIHVFPKKPGLIFDDNGLRRQLMQEILLTEMRQRDKVVSCLVADCLEKTRKGIVAQGGDPQSRDWTEHLKRVGSQAYDTASKLYDHAHNPAPGEYYQIELNYSMLEESVVNRIAQVEVEGHL